MSRNMPANFLETVLGVFIFFGAIGFLVTAYLNSNNTQQDTFRILARFQAIDGLNRGADIRIGGVKVGSVDNLSLDPMTYEAVVAMAIYDTVSIPKDSEVTIGSNGLLGGRHLRINPGKSQEFWQAGDEAQHTKDAIALEELLGKAIFLIADQP